MTSQYTTSEYYLVDNFCFILNNIPLTSDGVLNTMEIYADTAGTVQFDVLSFFSFRNLQYLTFKPNYF